MKTRCKTFVTTLGDKASTDAEIQDILNRPSAEFVSLVESVTGEGSNVMIITKLLWTDDIRWSKPSK